MHLKHLLTGVSCATMLCIPMAMLGASLSETDMRFMKMAATANMTEAHLGQMAEAQGSQARVKDYGKKLSMDHTTSYESLTVLANKVGEDIPKAISRDKAINRLARFKGKTFDRAFLLDEVQSHKTAIAAFKSEAEHGDNPDVKAWAQNMIPTLEGHLQAAEKLATQKK